MKLKKNECARFDDIKNTTTPYFGPDPDETPDWFGRPFNTSNRDIIEKTLTLVGDYEFNDESYVNIDDSKFCLFTTDNKKVYIDCYPGNIDDLDRISITQDNIVDSYDIVCITKGKKEKYLNVYPLSTTDLVAMFTQYYDENCDFFYKIENEKKIIIKLYRNTKNDNNEFYLTDDKLKQEFKKITFNNIIDLYYFLADRISLKDRSISIMTEDIKSGKIEELIEIKKGNLETIKLVREIGGNKVEITENFNSEKGNLALYYVSKKIKEIQEYQNELKLKLK